MFLNPTNSEHGARKMASQKNYLTMCPEKKSCTAETWNLEKPLLLMYQNNTIIGYLIQKNVYLYTGLYFKTSRFFFLNKKKILYFLAECPDINVIF